MKPAADVSSIAVPTEPVEVARVDVARRSIETWYWPGVACELATALIWLLVA